MTTITKSKWFILSGTLGAVAAIAGQLWFYTTRPQSESGLEIDTWMSLPMSLLFWVGLWLLLVSITMMSLSRWLRSVAILGTISLGIAAVCALSHIYITDTIALLYWAGYVVLLATAIVSIAMIIRSWIIKR